MRWEKIGVTTVSSPASHGGGLYLRLRKDLVEAYKLWEVEKVEFRIERVLRPAPENVTKPMKRYVPEKPEGGVE